MAVSRSRHAVAVSFMFGPLSMDTQKKKHVVGQRTKDVFKNVAAVVPTSDKDEITANRAKEGSEKLKELMDCLESVGFVVWLGPDGKFHFRSLFSPAWPRAAQRIWLPTASILLWCYVAIVMPMPGRHSNQSAVSAVARYLRGVRRSSTSNTPTTRGLASTSL